MRTADRRPPFGRSWLVAAAVALGVVFGACGGAPPSSPPPSATPVPTPAPTPVAHLTEPAKADAVYLALVRAGLRIAPNNASTGGPGHEPVKRINATYADWPLAITEYTSAKSLLADTKWKAGAPPGQGEPSIAFRGMNILIEWGPTTGASPKKPDARRLAAAEALLDALEPLVSPLTARSIVPIPGAASAAAPASPDPSAGASGAP